MPEIRLRTLSTPAATRLAELYLHQHDIEGSIKALELWSRSFEGLPEEDANAIRASLFRDAIVQFVGCFDRTDKEHRLAFENLYQGVDKADAYFGWLKDLRDAYAAHRFGPLRQVAVGAAELPNGKHALGLLRNVFMGPHQEEGPRLRAFMQIASKALSEKITELNEQVLQEVTSMTSQEFESLPWARTTKAVGAEEIRQSRAAFAKSRVVDVTSEPEEGGVYITVEISETDPPQAFVHTVPVKKPGDP